MGFQCASNQRAEVPRRKKMKLIELLMNNEKLQLFRTVFGEIMTILKSKEMKNEDNGHLRKNLQQVSDSTLVLLK